MHYLSWLIIILHVLVAAAASWHALLFKRDSRAAFGWLSVSILFPIVGPVLYYIFGINRVKSRARLLHRGQSGLEGAGSAKLVRRLVGFERGAGFAPLEKSRQDLYPAEPVQRGLVRASYTITGSELSVGNHVEVLHNGEGAYPPMLAAIAKAEHSISLMTYIFETNETGRQFIEALGEAVGRGVDVRVILDGMGEKYSFPRAAGLLDRAGVRVCRYNPPRWIPPNLSVNLRNHRKVLVVDNEIAFTGGINIGDRHLADNPAVKHPVADIHFALRGPVIDQLRSAFTDSWLITSGEQMSQLAPAEAVAGDSQCRVIVDGPDDNLDKLELVLLAAVCAAQQRIQIMTPYFLPSAALVGALQVAALRGVQVQVVLPEENNLRYVHWANRNMLWELLYYHIQVFYQPPPFAHSKLFLVDDDYALIGSANIDPRSLRLNFELGVEIYDQKLVSELTDHFEKTIETSRPVTLDEVDGRSLPVRTRDALCWLFSPYL